MALLVNMARLGKSPQTFIFLEGWLARTHDLLNLMEILVADYVLMSMEYKHG